MSDQTTPTIEGRRHVPRRLRRAGLVAACALAVPAGVFGSSSASNAERAPAASPAVGPVLAALDPTSTTADQEATRLALAGYLDDLQAVVDSQQVGGAVGPQLQSPAVDLSQAVDAARTLVDELDAAELEAMQDMIDVTPGWSEQPDVLADAVDANPYPLGAVPADGAGAVLSGYRTPAALAALPVSSMSGPAGAAAQVATAALAPRPDVVAPRSAGDPRGYISDCQGTPPNLRGLFYGYWIAAQIAGAAGAVAAGIPDAVTYIALTIITGVIFGVANGIAIGLQYELSKAQDCAAALSNATLVSTYPTDPSAVTPTNTAGYTPASTQTSVTSLTSIVGGIQQLLTTIDTKIVAILQAQLLVINAVGTAQNSANQIQATANDVQFRTDDLLANVGGPTDVAVEANGSVDCVPSDAPAGTPPPPPPAVPCNTANGLANTTDARMDTMLSDTADFQTLSVRMEIERALSNPSQPAIALFALPAVQGGYLETVRDIVITTIANEVAAGQGAGNAQTFVATANAAFAAGSFAVAYANYAKAYQAAVQ